MNTVSSSTKLYNNKGHDFFDDTWGWNNNNPPSNNNNNNSSGGGAGAGGNRNKNGGSNGGKDVFNMEELKARISSLKQSKSVAAPASSGLASSVKTSTDTPPPAKKPDEVHIILFNPDTEQEGVHTIEFPKGSGNNVILAFENAQACDMFSKLLKDQLYMDPIVSTWLSYLLVCQQYFYLKKGRCVYVFTHTFLYFMGLDRAFILCTWFRFVNSLQNTQK